MERDERDERYASGDAGDTDHGLVKVWGSLGVAAVYAIVLMLAIALAGEARALVAGIGTLIFLIGAVIYIFRQNSHRHRSH